MNKPLVSFFLGTLNRKEVIRETLQKLYEQTYRPIEIVVVDNHSSDGTAEMIEQDFPEVKLIRLTRNHGHVASRNIACVNTRGKYVVCLDDDAFPGKDAITRMVAEFQKDDILGLIVFDIYLHDPYIGYYDTEDHIPREQQVVEKYNWSGCGGAYRREIVEKLGFWEEWGIESPCESSIGAKAMLMGYTGKQFSDIYIFHHWSQVGDPATFRVYHLANKIGCRSYVLFIIKYFPADARMLKSLLEIAWISIFNLLETGSFSLLRGFLSAWTKVPYILRERMPLTWQQAKRLSLSFNFKGH